MKIRFFSLALISLTSMMLFSCNETKESEEVSSEPAASEVISSSEVVSSSIDWSKYDVAEYSNPVTVLKGERDYSGEVPDPSVVRGDDGMFYCFSTNRKMLSSENGCDWTVETENVIDLPSWGREAGNGSAYALWAPDVVKVNGQWIYYYTLSGFGNACGIGYAISSGDANGPYTDMGKLFSCSEIEVSNAIDQQVFVDDDGSVYMTFGSFQGIYVIELTSDGMALKDGLETQRKNKTLIAGYPGDWDGATYEGSYIIKKDGYYYYFGSSGNCCNGKDSTYKLMVARSTSIKGPYLDATHKGLDLTKSGSTLTIGEVVVYAPASMSGIIAGPGHNSIIVDDAGQYWCYYHAYSCNDKFATRHLFMDKLIWGENGFPYIEKRRPFWPDEETSYKEGPAILIK